MSSARTAGAIIRCVLYAASAAAGILCASLVPQARPAPAAAVVASRASLILELATTRVLMKTIQKGVSVEKGLLWNASDEILCSTIVEADYGFNLEGVRADVRMEEGLVSVSLPAPRLLAPGFKSKDVEILDNRSSRWFTDSGPGYARARQEARANALNEAQARVDSLEIERDIRNSARSLLERLIPAWVGDPGIRVAVRFDGGGTGRR